MQDKNIKLNFKVSKSALGLGAQVKNSICFIKGDSATISAGHRDLNSPQDLAWFEKDVKRFLKYKPSVIGYDLHPDYQSTKYAQLYLGSRLKLKPVQHHHAHTASCMAENNLGNQKVIGVVFDGTGLGKDTELWGAEFLICDYKGFERVAYLEAIPLLGAEKAIKEPWRVAAAWLYSAYRDSFMNLKIGFVKKIEKRKWSILKNMYNSNFNSPYASSMGRLFDAVASMLFEESKVNHEAQLAVKLEKLAWQSKLNTGHYTISLRRSGGAYIVSPGKMFREIVADLRKNTPGADIAYKFHSYVAEAIKGACLRIREDTHINKTVLSGGVFQNKLLLKMALKLLYQEGFIVFIHKNISSNDSGISLGQAVIAAYS